MSDVQAAIGEAVSRYAQLEPVLLFRREPELNVDKFWRIRLEQRAPVWAAVVSWGRAGTAGQSQEKVYDMRSAATTFGADRITEKLKQGYRLESEDERQLRAFATDFTGAEVTATDFGRAIEDLSKQIATIVGYVCADCGQPTMAPGSGPDRARQEEKIVPPGKVKRKIVLD